MIAHRETLIKLLLQTTSPGGGLLTSHHGDDGDDVGRVVVAIGATLVAFAPPIFDGFFFVSWFLCLRPPLHDSSYVLYL
jgi:hypothetical protein